ncbi:lysophospholipid acyltransferase family protein [Kosmotoga pacifica]|uniref:Phospholipid/glycerol acyltransferase domain-containing protein n=1 Tax=Kosmotoga pacifica TaxID=1330330 RepID=A0A0G2ZEQ1_9BACT|nr:lysophospholipid acyltransferase family protein [Kosmotoga pacifica]AKI98024.1 hypothetical protein IX53_09520 [Kosmotoga pacifica]
MIKKLLIHTIYEVIWLLYAGIILFILPLIAKSKARGELPKPPFIMCVTHVGNFDPLFVVRTSGRYRAKALYQVDGPYPLVRFLYKAIWRFRVTQDPKIKQSLNKETIRDVILYLRRGGTVMIFPEGYWNWKKRLYPGVAVIAHRANVPIVPVGIENGYVFRPELDDEPPLKAVRRVIKDYRKRGTITVHYGEPIYPDMNREERADVEQIMKAIEEKFAGYYYEFYDMEGPKWAG